MNLHKLLLLAILAGTAGIALVGNWFDGHLPGQQPMRLGSAPSAQVQDVEQGDERRSEFGHRRVEQTGSAVVDPSDAASANVIDGPGGQSPSQETRATNEAEMSAGEPGSIGEASGGDLTAEPTDGEATLSISGWVQDDAGEPAVGIQVKATARHLFTTPQGGAPGASQGRRIARTDQAGYFELTELGDGEYLISTVATARYQSAKARVRAGADSAVLVVEGDTRHEVHVYGTVSDSQGRPLPGVRIRTPGAAGATSSGNDGRYSLALSVGHRDQSYSVRFTKRGYQTQSTPLAGTALEDGGEIPLDAALERVEETAPVDGRVVDPTGTAIPGVRVRLWSSQLQRSYTTRSNDAGGFSFPAVDVGEDYRLWIRPRSGYEEYIEQPVAVLAGGVNLPVTLEPLESGTLEGRMVGADGAPVPGVSLWLRIANPSRQPYRIVRGDAHGQFKVDDLPQGEVSFSTRASPYLQVTGVHFSPGVQDNVELWLDLGMHETSGYVSDGNGDPVAGVQVSMTWSLAEGGVQSRSKRSTVTDAAGTFLFTQVGLGWHTLAFDVPGYRPTRLDHFVGSGEEVTVRLQKDHS